MQVRSCQQTNSFIMTVTPSGRRAMEVLTPRVCNDCTPGLCAATYGAPGNRTAGDRIYGPSAVPCKPCPNGMTAPALSTSYDAWWASQAISKLQAPNLATLSQCATLWLGT